MISTKISGTNKVIGASVLKVTVMIPCYNEEQTIGEVVKRTLEVPLECDREVVVIDDGSTDNSASVVKPCSQVKLIVHDSRRGKGSAIKTGIQNSEGDIIVIQDADLEYLPEDIPKLIKPIIDGEAEVVFGSRFKGSIKGMSVRHWFGNKILTLTTCLLYSTWVTDVMTGHKAFAKEAIKNLKLRSKGFGIELEITARVLQRGYKIHEIPIHYRYRRSGFTKISWVDGFKSLFWLIKSKFFDRD